MITPATFRDPLESMNSYLVASDYFQPSKVKVVPPAVEMLTSLRYPDDILRFLERAIRTVDKSELAWGADSHKQIIQQVLSQKPELAFEHESGLDHVNLTFRIHASQEVTRELARQRMASHTQASMRYISYESGVEASLRDVSYAERPPEVILPWHLLASNDPEMAQFWKQGMETEFALYMEAMSRFNWTSEEACGFLPSDSSSEIVTTMSIRSWRNFLRLRTAPEARADMQVVAREMLRLLMLKLPILFQDIQDQVDARLEGKDQWLEKGESEIKAREPRTYHQWHEVMPPTPRPGTGIPGYRGWTRPAEEDLQRDPSKDYYVPYADVKNRPDLMEEWAFKHLSRLVAK